MTDLTLTPAAEEGRRERRRTIAWTAAIPGVLFAVTFVGGNMIWSQPDDTASDATWVAYMADRQHRVVLVISAYLLVVAAVALPVFLTRLARRIDGDTRDPLTLLATGTASVFIALSGFVWAAIPGATLFGSQAPATTADLIRFSFNLGYPIELVGSAIALACAIGLLTLRARRSGYFGRAMTVFGWIAVAACLAAVFFLPLAITVAWILTVSVVMARRPGRTEPPSAEIVGEAVTAPSAGTTAHIGAPRVEEAAAPRS